MAEVPYNAALERAKYFQTVQAWPLSDELNYDGWLSNFKTGEERTLASVVLDFFTHYSSKLVIQMLKTAVSSSGYTFQHFFPNWSHSDFQDKCIYSFIPGETKHPTDSGYFFTRILRDHLNVPESRIIEYSDIPEALNALNVVTPIVLVDDFVGSGAQVDKAWNENKFRNGLTFSQICANGGHCVVYSPLIINSLGYQRIKRTCGNLFLHPTHILGEEYNIFSSQCICWKNDETLRKKGIALILRKSRDLNILDTNGQSTTDLKGFGKQGLALSFAHGAPDAILPIFYWNKSNWIPLIHKTF